MVLTFTQAACRLPNAQAVVDQAFTQYGQAKTKLQKVSDDLDGLAGEYSEMIAALNSGATDPGGPARLAAKDLKDAAVADRATIIDRVDAILLAFAKVAATDAATVTAKLNEL